MLENGVMLQVFHWHSKADGSLWTELAERAPELAAKGFTSVWLPPAYKGAGGQSDVGYAVYDLYDLGEFDQKGSVRTKYGTREELLRACRALRERKVTVLLDIVLNHRCGADETEEVEGHPVSPDNRNEVAPEPRRFEAWTRFTFPGRAGKYSEFTLDHRHFIAVDCEKDAQDCQVHLLKGKTFSGDVSFEQGNYDFLMGCDVDTYDEAMREELFRWGTWLHETTKANGFRMDALKHVPAAFIKDWLAHVRAQANGKELFAVGEYWTADLGELLGYMEKLEGTLTLFDVPLHFRFLEASKAGNAFDMRTVLDGSLVAQAGTHAVTFVDNHDSQPGCSLESWVEPWFKPLAYALIMLRREGYPCVFAADYDGFEGEPVSLPSHRVLLDAMLDARGKYNFGDQHDFFDHPNCIAWLRTGDEEHPGAMVVVMSNGDAGTKRIPTGRPNATFFDRTGHLDHEVTTDETGEAEFACPPGSLSIWLMR